MKTNHPTRRGGRSAVNPLKKVPWGSPALAAVLSFFLIALDLPDTTKWTTMLLIVLTLVAGFVALPKLYRCLTAPVAALGLVVLMDGLSLFYAPSGKFALSEFLQVVFALCFAVLLLLLAKGEGDRPGRWIASVLEGCTALGALVSIDLIATRLISTPILFLLGLFDDTYFTVNGLEQGTRITSMYLNPNVFAGMVGLGVLLSLGLTLSAETRRERTVHLVCLFTDALAFVLAFSMGASAMIALAFLVYLALERRERRGALFLLMVKTLLLTVLAAMVISTTSFQARTGLQPVPLLALAAGAAALCLSDRFLDERLLPRLAGSRKLPLLIAATVLLLAAYAVAACLITGGVTLEAGGGLRRAAYPDSGAYTLAAEGKGAVSVTVESQNQRDTMMHTSTVLYQGDLAGAAFTVPEDSLVVYFNFSAPEDARLDSVTLTGGAASVKVPLGYRLLPGFIANRLQGLLANQNAIQRLVFFSDGMVLFRRSPLVGLGLGAFENGVMSVQSFYYVARHAHNHYVQAAVETGLVGLLLFVGLIAVSAAAVLLQRRREDAHCLTPALGAALVFMAGHAAVEVVFSYYSYLPVAFAVFALIGLCCPLPRPLPEGVKTGAVLGGGAMLAVFALLLAGNLQAKRIIQRDPTFEGLSKAAAIDKFEWSDYMLTYVANAATQEVSDEVFDQADRYAERLAQLNSNSLPLYLAEYYLRTGRTERGIEMVEKYVNYVASDPQTWQRAFLLLERYEEDSPDYRAAVLRIAGLLEDWNRANMGEITLDETALAFIDRVR